VLLERLCEAIKAALPQAAVTGEPGFELVEGLSPQRVQALLAERAHRDEAHLIQYPQVSGYSGLMDSGVLDDLTHRLLAALQRLDDAAPGGVSERLKSVYIHSRVYIYLRILCVKVSC